MIDPFQALKLTFVCNATFHMPMGPGVAGPPHVPNAIFIPTLATKQ